MDPKYGVLFSMLIQGCVGGGGAKCKFQLPVDYVNARPIGQMPTEILVVMVVNDLVKVDDNELSYTIDITCVTAYSILDILFSRNSIAVKK